MATTGTGSLSFLQKSVLVLMRIAIGWHFLYEGLVKLLGQGWTSAAYLESSRWVLADFFHWIAATPSALRAVDLMNMWGLTLIGAALMLGCFSRIASAGGAALLALYYVANPPFAATGLGIVAEGSYLVVDKNLVEFAALCVLAAIPTGRFLGLDGLMRLPPKRPRPASAAGEPVPLEGYSAEPDPAGSPARRELLKGLATAPFAFAFVGALWNKRWRHSYEEKNLFDAVSSATVKRFDFSSLDDLKGQVPAGDLKGLRLSRVLMGGNLIGGWAHARDLIYVSRLVKAYHHDEKVFETLLLAEKCGVNTILTNPALCGIIQEYWKRGIGKIQFISDCGGANLIEGARVSIDTGACAGYIHGGMADNLVKEGRYDEIAKTLDFLRANGLPAGIGGHCIETVKGCVEHGLEPDFWMKTLHPGGYWSARHAEECDNVYCRNPEETIEFMKTIKQPWIAFKTLGAGAVHPKDGFRYAFENGADFICVGMYDFQIVDDVNTAIDILDGGVDRARPWMA